MTMKRMMLVWVMVLCLIPVAAWADGSAVEWFNGPNVVYNSLGEHFTYEVEDGHAILTRYWTEPQSAQPSLVVIPDTLNGYSLTEIDDCAFNCIEAYDGVLFNGQAVECVVIPEGVTTLRDGALCWSHHIDGIRQFRLPSTLECIQNDGLTFENCYAEISFPNGNPFFEIRDGFLIDNRTDALLYCNPSAAGHPLPRVRRVENRALENYSRYQTVLEFPDSVEYIGSFNAYDCVDLEKIIVPGSVIELADNAFQCNAASEIILNEGLQRVGYWTFADTEITSLTIPSTVSWIGFEPFGWWEPEDGNLVVLNPDVYWETEDEWLERTENDMEE